VARKVSGILAPIAFGLGSLVALAVGFFQVFIGGVFNSDGASYCDVADAYLRGDFHDAISSYWSPVYPWLIAALFSVRHPASIDELRLLYAMNFLIFTAVLLLFCLLIRELDRENFSFWIVGFSISIWSTVYMIGLELVTPDVLVCGLVVALSIFLLRTFDGRLPAPQAIAFGATAGICYLTKLSMFPVACVAVGLVLIRGLFRRAELRGALLVGGTFVLIVGTWGGILSTVKHRVTLGDVGTLNYAWYVSMVRPWVHWAGGLGDNGLPLHQTRVDIVQPPIFVFDREFPQSTYPLWYDAPHWYEGLRIHFDLQKQLTATRSALHRMAGAASSAVPALLVIIVMFATARFSPRPQLLRVASILAAACAGPLLYALIYVEKRFLGGYFGVLILVAFSVASAGQPPKWIVRVGSVVIAITLIGTTLLKLNETFVERLAADGKDERAVAIALHAAGIGEGTHVANLGNSFESIGWCRLAHLHIVCDIPDSDLAAFWSASPEMRRRILGVMKDHHADVVLSSAINPDDHVLEWKPVPGSNLFFLPLR